MKRPIVTLAHAGGKPVRLDVMRLCETRLQAQASSGGGKSYALRKVLEITHGHVQQLIIDTDGEFGSLRKEFDFLYIAKGEAHVPDAATAALLARTLLELRVSAIIDIYELHPRERRRFARLFLEALVDAPKNLWHPTLVVLDEAHEYAPEQSESEALDAVIALAAKGRKRDFACILATQRPAKLHKDVAAECQNKLVGLANQDIDRKRSGDELGFRHKEELLSLRNLEPGEFYVLGPAFLIGNERVREPVKVMIDPVVTPHGRKAKSWRPGKAATSRQVKAALEALAKLPKQAEQEAKDLEAAKVRIRELDRELRELKKGQPKKDPALEAKLAELQGRLNASEKGLEKMKKDMVQLKNRLKAKLAELGVLVDGIPTEAPTAEGPPIRQPHPYTEHATRARPPMPPLRAAARLEVTADAGDVKIGPTEKAIVRFLAARSGRAFSRVQIGVGTGYRRKSSTFQAAFPKLVRLGWIHQAGSDFYIDLSTPQPNELAEIIQDVGAAPDRPEDWLPKLQPTPRKVLEVLLEHRDAPLTREEISERTGYKLKSSTFQAAFPELEKIGLIKKAGQGMVQFNSESFTQEMPEESP